MILSAILGWLALTTMLTWGHTPTLLQRQLTGNAMYSMNVTNCPGTLLPTSTVELISMHVLQVTLWDL